MTEQGRAVFLSYASQDAEAARRICETLRAAGIEVWLDQSELRGGDAWDRRIRKQIHDCALVVAVISAHTEERTEGYFRLEWKLAVDRSHLMAEDAAFVIPVVIDGTSEATARVPDKFREVQWTHLPAGETSPGFVQRVSHLLSPGQAHAPAEVRLPAAAAPHTAPWPRQPAPGRAALRQTQRLLLLIAAVAVIGGGYIAVDKFVLSKRIPEPVATATTPTSAAQSTIPEKSIAVLPFVNMSSDKEQDYFSDGLSEELIDMLSKVPDLRVPARTSSFYFKGKNETIETMAKQLKVANLLEGSVRKAGDRLRITAQLIRADNGFHLWSETYDRDAKDIFKVQDEIAAAVVEALKIRLAPGKQAASSHRTSNAEAYNEYLIGRQFYNRGDVDALQHSIDAYKRAIALDPDYAAAYAGLAISESSAADMKGDSAGLERASTAADKAIALAPNEPDGYAARGFLRFDFDWNWPGAMADLKKAVLLDPSDSDAQRRYGDLLLTLGRPKESIAAMKKALEADPLAARSWGDLANSLTAVHDYGGAHEALRRALEINPDSAYILSDLATLQLLEGKFQEALDNFRQAKFEAFQLPGAAMAEHSLGHDAESQRALDEAVAKVAKESAYQIAEAFAWRGEKDRAFEWLERAYQQRDGGLVAINTDPLLGSLHSDSRYKALLRKMKLPE